MSLIKDHFMTAYVGIGTAPRIRYLDTNLYETFNRKTISICVLTLQFWLKSYESNRHFAWKPTCVSCAHSSAAPVNIHRGEACFLQRW
jgi:hypothetical protein